VTGDLRGRMLAAKEAVFQCFSLRDDSRALSHPLDFLHVLGCEGLVVQFADLGFISRRTAPLELVKAVQYLHLFSRIGNVFCYIRFLASSISLPTSPTLTLPPHLRHSPTPFGLRSAQNQAFLEGGRRLQVFSSSAGRRYLSLGSAERPSQGVLDESLS
jgi:hypothetical protein